MESVKTYEHFPVSKVFVAVLVTLSIYALGAAVLSGFGALATALYLLYCIGAEVHVMKKSCIDCYYYGRQCAFGRGRLAALLFRQGDTGRFAAKCISGKDLLPDLFVVLIPLAGGLVLLFKNFSWTTALMLAALLALSTSGNYLVRSRIACKYCRQRELGCPAERFFGKKPA